MIALLLGLLLSWTLVCFLAGAVWEAYREDAKDLNERDAWAERYQDEQMKGAA